MTWTVVDPEEVQDPGTWVAAPVSTATLIVYGCLMVSVVAEEGDSPHG